MDTIQRLTKFLENDFLILCKLIERQRHYVVRLALDWVRGNNRHWIFSNACPLFHKERQAAFRRMSEFEDFNESARWFEVIHSHSVQASFSKGYRLQNRDVIDRVGVFLRRDAVRVKPIRDYNGNILTKPPHAIISRDSNGNMRKSRCQLASSVVRIDDCRLLKLREHLTHPDDYQKQYIVDSLIHQSNLKGFGQGHIVQQYRECPHGRLMGISSDGIHLQRAYKWLREAALAGQYYYDIEACHLTLMSEIAGVHGVRLRSIEYAIHDKRKFRNELAERHCIDYETVKKALAALSYGAELSISPYKALRKEIFCGLPEDIIEDVLPGFIRDEEIIGLVNDIKLAHDIILENCTISRGKTKNIIGKCHEGKSPTLVSHILLGYEARALAIAIEQTNGNLSLLVHDGFVSPVKIDIDRVTKQFENETGLRIRYECKRLGSNNYKFTPHAA